MPSNQKELSILLTLKDQATKQLKGFERSLSSLARFSRRVLFPAIGIASGAIGALGGMAINAAGDLEQMKIAFETMLGSTEKADEFTRDLINFAKTTPFELKGLQQASKQLLAYGFAQEEVLPNLKALGDIAAGVGMDKLPNLILAFGQVRAATRLTGMELRQFTEAGVPLLDELAKKFNKTAREIQEMVSEGEIGFKDVQEALMNLTKEGGRFNNLMERQSKSFKGMLSNLRDAWDIFLQNQGAKFLDFAKTITGYLIDFVQNTLPVWVDNFSKKMEELYRRVEPTLLLIRDVFVVLAQSIQKAGGVVQWIKQQFNNLLDFIESHTGIITVLKQAIEDVALVFQYNLLPELQKLWERLRPLMPFLKTLARVFGVMLLGAIIGLVKVLEGSLIVGFTVLEDVIKRVNQAIDIFRWAWDQVTTVLSKVVDWLDKVYQKIQNLNFVRGIGNAIGNFLGFGGARQMGGLVQAGRAYLVGEQGPELFVPSGSGRIVPNHQLAGAGANITINITGNTFLDEEVAEKMGDMIIQKLKYNSLL